VAPFLHGQGVSGEGPAGADDLLHGVPDTAPEMLTEAKMEAYLAQAPSRIGVTGK